MDEHDELSRKIYNRIDYEKRQRNLEYLKRLADYGSKFEKDKLELDGSRGVSPGVNGHYKQLQEELDKEYETLRAIDDDRHQEYWRQLEDEKYIHPPADAERAENMEKAERSLKYKIKNFEETGLRISSSEWKAMEDLYGRDVMELVKNKVDLDREEARKQEAGRLKKIQEDKEKYLAEQKLKDEREMENDKKNEKAPLSEQERLDKANQEHRRSIYDLARDEITRQSKRDREMDQERDR